MRGMYWPVGVRTSPLFVGFVSVSGGVAGGVLGGRD